MQEKFKKYISFMNVSADVFGDSVEILLDFFHILMRVQLTIKRKDMTLRIQKRLPTPRKEDQILILEPGRLPPS